MSLFTPAYTAMLYLEDTISKCMVWLTKLHTPCTVICLHEKVCRNSLFLAGSFFMLPHIVYSFASTQQSSKKLYSSCRI